MRTSDAGIALLKQFEGCRLEAYQLPGEKYFTIGFGHYGTDVQPGMKITQERAEQYLKDDLMKYESLVLQYAKIELNQNRFDALVSYTYNRGAGGIKELSQNCHTVEEYSAGIVKYWGKAEKYKEALIERRKKERALFDTPVSGKEAAMEVIIGSARSDERKAYSGGAAGDQRQGGAPDYSGEVSMQKFYIHSKGWYILRAKDADHAEKIAENMVFACNNANIGYDQSQRLGIITKGVHTTEKTECDCSSLVRECVKEATGKDPGNFTTGDEANALVKTGLFEKLTYADGTKLYTGDVLVTKTKGHTVIVTSGAARKNATANDGNGGSKTIEQIAAEVIQGKWGSGDERRKRLAAAGYSYLAVQAVVNAKLNGKTMSAEHITQIAKEVIAGKWGVGDARRQKLKAKGYDPDLVQAEVNRLMR